MESLMKAKDEQIEKTGENIIEGAEKSLFDLAERGNFSQTFLKFNQALDQTIEMATLAMKSDQGIVGVPTGLTDLDEKLGGLHKSDLIIIAGRDHLWVKQLLQLILLTMLRKICRKIMKKVLLLFFL